jgi:cellobiose-specific phosphotransferase system component IIB
MAPPWIFACCAAGLSDSRVARQVVQAIRDGERQKRLYLLILPQAALAQITQWIVGPDIEYIEANPVSAGLAATPEDWPWSSATKAS